MMKLGTSFARSGRAHMVRSRPKVTKDSPSSAFSLSLESAYCLDHTRGPESMLLEWPQATKSFNHLKLLRTFMMARPTLW